MSPAGPLPHFIDTARAAADDGSTPTVLALHGLGGDASYWDDTFTVGVEGTPCRTISWTMPGYGPSAALETTTIASLADAALSLLDHLGIEQAVVVGHSMGGFIAQQLAASHPDRVHALVLVATTAVFGKPGSDFNEQFLQSRLAPIEKGLSPADFADTVAAGLVGPNADVAIVDRARDSMTRISAAGYRAAIEALVQFDARHLLPSLTIPVLGIAGSDDATASAKVMQDLIDLVPNGRLEVIDDVGHLVNLEASGEFDSLVASFLAELTRAGVQ